MQSENSDIQQVYSMYLAMDHMNFGAQKQLLVMDPEAFEYAFNNFRTPLKVNYWKDIQLGDTAEEAMQKAGLVKEDEPGIFLMLNMQDVYFERRGYILSNDGKVDALFAYTYVDKDRKGEKAKIRLDELRNSMIALIQRNKVVTEGAGALACAALLSGKLDQYIQNRKTVSIISGGNIDLSRVSQITGFVDA